MKVLVFIPFIAFAISGDVERLKKDGEKHRGELEHKVEDLRRRALEESKKIRYENGKIVVQENNQESRSEGVKSLDSDEKLYILMSSSVPLSIWRRYARALEVNGLNRNGVFVLRGCINGCSYIKPTIEFLKKVYSENAKVEVQIDPLIFRRFNVKAVPCFVYVKGDVLQGKDLSAGLEGNLKVKGSHAISCGDWSFEHHMKELCKKTNSEGLCKIVKP